MGGLAEGNGHSEQRVHGGDGLLDQLIAALGPTIVETGFEP